MSANAKHACSSALVEDSELVTRTIRITEQHLEIQLKGRSIYRSNAGRIFVATSLIREVATMSSSV